MAAMATHGLSGACSADAITVGKDSEVGTGEWMPVLTVGLAAIHGALAPCMIPSGAIVMNAYCL